MTIKDRIHAEIDGVPDERLGELYDVVKRFSATNSQPGGQKPGVLSRLKRIKIDVPDDFATNLVNAL
jgi:hypothetical protein